MYTRISRKGWQGARRVALAAGACALLPAWSGEAPATPATLATPATAGAAGRWEGQVQIPGQAMRLVLDLQPDAQGRWRGSVVLPGRGVKGAAVSGLEVDPQGVKFGLASAFRGSADPPPQVALHWRADDQLAGTFSLSGLEAPVNLARTGAAQLDPAPWSLAITATLAGTWTGRYELGGVPRQVTLTLANRVQGGVDGTLVIVGKRTTRLDVDQVLQGREYVTVGASRADFHIEGRFDGERGTIEGGVSQGPFEAAIRLQRQEGQGRAS